MKNENPRILWIVISFAWRLLDIFEKCTENENYQIFKFTVLTIFSFKSMKSTKTPKMIFFVLYDITLYKTEVFELAHKLKYYALLFLKIR